VEVFFVFLNYPLKPVWKEMRIYIYISNFTQLNVCPLPLSMVSSSSVYGLACVWVWSESCVACGV